MNMGNFTIDKSDLGSTIEGMIHVRGESIPVFAHIEAKAGESMVVHVGKVAICCRQFVDLWAAETIAVYSDAISGEIEI